MGAVCPEQAEGDDFWLAGQLSRISKTDVPEAVAKLADAPVRHDFVCEKDGMEEAVKEFLS